MASRRGIDVGGDDVCGTASSAGATLRAAALVLLDFDGPVTRLLPAPEYLELAAAAVRLVADAGVEVPAQVRSLTDHGAVLLEVGQRWPDLLDQVEAHCDAVEVLAARTRQPAAGLVELLEVLAAAEIPVAIVTNNGAACVHAFLDRHALAGQVREVYGRLPGRSDRLKPSPAMLLDAATAVGVSPERTVMVGDSVTDIVAATRAGIPAIGLTPATERRRAMTQAGAVAIVDTTADLLARLQTSG